MKNIYKCEFNKKDAKSKMVESWVHPIPVFNVTINNKKLTLSSGNKEKEISIADIKKICVKLSTGLIPAGVTQGILYHIDLHVYFNNEEVILEFTDYRSLNALVEKLRSMNMVLEDKMGLLKIVEDVDSYAKKIDVYRYFQSNMNKLESEFGFIEKNRLKNKYVGNY